MSGRFGSLFLFRVELLLFRVEVAEAIFDHSSLFLCTTGHTTFVGPMARKTLQVSSVSTLIGREAALGRRVHRVSHDMCWIGILIRYGARANNSSPVASPEKKMESYLPDSPWLIVIGYVACVLTVLLQIPCELCKWLYCYYKRSCHVRGPLIQPLKESASSV